MKNTSKATIDRLYETTLDDIQRNCLDQFNVQWAMQKLKSNSDVPEHFRELIALTLLGWIFFPRTKQTRDSLAWHCINTYLDKMAKSTLKAREHKDYALAFAAAIKATSDGYGKLFTTLAGVNSKRNYSRIELSERLSKQAKRFQPCLAAVNLMVMIDEKVITFGPKSETSLKTVKNLLSAWEKRNPLPKSDKLKRVRQYSAILNPSYGIKPKGGSFKTIEKYWSNFRFGAEFVVALLTMIRDRDWNPTGAPKIAAKLRSNANAFNFIEKKSYYLLPFGDINFQQEWISRAKHFSKYLHTRDLPDLQNRFLNITEVRVPLDLVHAGEFSNLYPSVEIGTPSIK